MMAPALFAGLRAAVPKGAPEVGRTLPAEAAATLQPEAAPTVPSRSEGSGEASTGKALDSVPRFSIGVGVRAFLNDVAIPGIVGSIRLVELGDHSLSIRPVILFPASSARDEPYRFNSKTQFRVPITFDFFQRGPVGLFLGGGWAPRFDSSDHTATMATAGGELRASSRLSFGLTGNWVFRKWTPQDTKDREALFSVSYHF